MRSDRSLEKFIIAVIAMMSIVIITISCSENSKGRSKAFSGNSNSPSSLSVGYGRVLKDNPIILSNNEKLDAKINYGSLLSAEQVFITTAAKLENSCGPTSATLTYTLNQCFKVLKTKYSTPLLPIAGTWGYDPNSLEFLEIHTYYHQNKLFTLFQDILAFMYGMANPLGPGSGTGGGTYTTSLPASLYDKGAFWYHKELETYVNAPASTITEGSGSGGSAKATIMAASYFSPSNFTISMGTDPSIAGFFNSTQDPAMIYHESSHALVNTLFNLRNRNAGISSVTGVDFGTYTQDEPMSLNEGLADFTSYMMTKRARFAEWGAGRFYGGARPLTETDGIHPLGLGLSSDDDSRLSYPMFLNYNPNSPTSPVEDCHNGGLTATHFLVALSNELISNCSFDQAYALKVVYGIIIETLAELGDLTSIGSDNQSYLPAKSRINHSYLTDKDGRLLSKLWVDIVNPVNYRKFFQTFSKYFLKLFTITSGRSAPLITCTGGTYGQDKLEKLLDKYGLLLFKTYNDNGNGYAPYDGTPTHTPIGHYGTLTQVNSANRKRSILIPKKYLILNPESNSSKFFIFDDQTNMQSIINNLKSNGQITRMSSMIPSTLPFNNNNANISPGEVVGVSFALYNNSNSTMAGVQVLGNDWHHGVVSGWDPTPYVTPGDYYSGDPNAIYSGDMLPCNTFEDKFPLSSEGAAPVPTSTPQVGECGYITRTNGIHNCSLAITSVPAPTPCTSSDHEMSRSSKTQTKLMPICLVQLSYDNESRWVSQKTYMKHVGLAQEKCLYSDSPYDCFIKVIPGAESQYFSKINAKSTWGKTLVLAGSPAPEFNSGHMTIFEVNPRTPPGTTFDCRFRTRFTNCDDCWHDSSRSDNDDYLDYEYSGGAPFQIIHFKFMVTD
ncbi:MAG: hypothetical protein HQK49_18085 [Oligoflexia bacterium]|nr:hypothetical protein [Oligoflexia bacterium]